VAIKIDIDRQIGLKLRTKERQERHQSADKARDIDDFLDLIAEAWGDYQNRIATPRANWVPIKYMRPKEFVESPDTQSNVILFKLKSRKRMNMTSDGERRPRTPAIREQITDPNDSENMITILAEKRENIGQFEVWSKHSKKANQIALQFEGFMQAYDWYPTDKGINRVWFEERKEDRDETIGGTEWSVRPLLYLIITELIYQEVNRKIGLITVRHDSGSKLKTVTLDEDTGLKEHSIDRGSSS